MFKAFVWDNGEKIELPVVRWIDLDNEGKPQRICGDTGLQYEEFELVLIDDEGKRAVFYKS